MSKLNAIPVLLCLGLFVCGQNRTSIQSDAHNESLRKQLSFDTSKIIIFAVNSANAWLFKNPTAFELTTKDLERIDKLLINCINLHNVKEDPSKKNSEYIDLNKYRRQYVPFINSKGEKKVYVNCFYILNDPLEFNYWKKSLVQVMDGGSCFFNVTINLSANEFEKLFINGSA